jgi:hypothetical protein
MEIGENFLEMVKFLTTKKITRSEHSELTFLAMKIEQLKISKMVKFGHFTGKGILSPNIANWGLGPIRAELPP